MTGNEHPPSAAPEDAVPERALFEQVSPPPAEAAADHGHQLAVLEHGSSLAIVEVLAGHAPEAEAEAAPAPVVVAEPLVDEPVAAETETAEHPAVEAVAAEPVAVAAEPVAVAAEPGDEEAVPPEPAIAEPVVPEAAVAESSIIEPVAAEPGVVESSSEETVAEPVAIASATPANTGAPRTVGFDPRVEERKRRLEEHWQHVVASRDNGETLQGKVTTAVKGGLLVDVGGVRGFLPASQTRLEPGATVESLVKTNVPLRVIDIDEKRRRIVVSHRRALDDQRRTKRNELLRSLKVGQPHDGLVVRLAPFGAFVDIGGVEGLIPMSELAFERVEKVEDVLKIGDRVPVTILRIEEGGRKIGLSRKNALPDPIRDHAALLRPGNVVRGKVVAKEPRLEVEIAAGLVGSVRESDADPNDYEIGEELEVSVRYIDRRTRRVVLTTMHGAAAALPRSTGFAPLGEELRRRK